MSTLAGDFAMHLDPVGPEWRIYGPFAMERPDIPAQRSMIRRISIQRPLGISVNPIGLMPTIVTTAHTYARRDELTTFSLNAQDQNSNSSFILAARVASPF
jgi:hypothetical protein